MQHENDNTKALLWRAVVDLAGGADVARALQQHHGHGHTITKLAREQGVSKSTMSRRMSSMRSTLASYGLLPETWR